MESKISNVTTGMVVENYRQILATVPLRENPHQVVKEFWSVYKSSANQNNRNNGTMFEWIVCECLVQFSRSSFYYDPKNDQYDLASWTEEGFLIIVSCMTSLRERWKQYNLRGHIRKVDYPKAESYLITLNWQEAASRKRDIENGNIPGIDEVYLADAPEFDEFVARMSKAGMRGVSPLLPLEGTLLGS